MVSFCFQSVIVFYEIIIFCVVLFLLYIALPLLPSMYLDKTFAWLNMKIVAK